jgi:hypothetical protein
MNQRSKLNSQENNQEQELASTHQTQQPGAKEFATPEEMLRHDATHTAVPPGIPFRLRDSIGGTPSPRTSWWKRLLGGSGQ